MTEWLLLIKRCRRCQVVKWKTLFPKSKSNKDGVNSWCHACYNEKSKARYTQPGAKERKRSYDIDYHFKNKERIKVRWREYTRARTADGWRSTWAKDNPEARRAIARNYKSRRRSQCEQGMSTKELRVWLSYQQFLCVWCGADCAESYHIDHVWPLSKGGKHEWNNLAIACPTCNLRKSARDPIEFAKEMQELAA